jgi:hypothetical protein
MSRLQRSGSALGEGETGHLSRASRLKFSLKNILYGNLMKLKAKRVDRVASAAISGEIRRRVIKNQSTKQQYYI